MEKKKKKYRKEYDRHVGHGKKSTCVTKIPESKRKEMDLQLYLESD